MKTIKLFATLKGTMFCQTKYLIDRVEVPVVWIYSDIRSKLLRAIIFIGVHVQGKHYWCLSNKGLSRMLQVYVQINAMSIACILTPLDSSTKISWMHSPNKVHCVIIVF